MKLQLHVAATFFLSALSLAAECGSKPLSDITDASSFSAYEDNYRRARALLCGLDDPCLDGSQDCFVEIVMDSKSTLRLSRSSQDAKADFSGCPGAVENIIQQCVHDGSMAEGSWTLPNQAYQFSVVTTQPLPAFGGAAQDPSLPQPDVPTGAPMCTDCGIGGFDFDSSKCKGGLLDGQECCSDSIFCDGGHFLEGCDGQDGKCTNHFKGCACKAKLCPIFGGLPKCS
jgi:hypothetical protein